VKIRITIGFCLLIPFLGVSQGELNNWVFGHHAGINFASGTPVAIPNVSSLFYSQNSTASVSDSLGNLLFYVDIPPSYFPHVYNRNNVQMPNGSLVFAGFGGTAYPFMAIQDLTNDSVYFLFYVVNPFPVSDPGGLVYSIVEMRLDGGLGDIVSGKNCVPIYSGSQARCVIIGTKHQNN
jgi:hypothetical protein